MHHHHHHHHCHHHHPKVWCTILTPPSSPTGSSWLETILPFLIVTRYIMMMSTADFSTYTQRIWCNQFKPIQIQFGTKKRNDKCHEILLKILWFPGNKIESVLPKQLPDLLHDLGCWGCSQQGPALAELEAQVVIIMTMNMFLGHDLIFRFLALRGSEIFIFERPPLTSEVMFQMFIFHQTLKLNDFLKDWSGGEGAGSVLQYKVNMIAMWRRLMWIWDWWSWRQGRQWGWIYQSGHAEAAIINIVSSTSLCDNADADVDDASS